MGNYFLDIQYTKLIIYNHSFAALSLKSNFVQCGQRVVIPSPAPTMQNLVRPNIIER